MFCFDLSFSDLRISVSLPTSNLSPPTPNRTTPPNSYSLQHRSAPQHPTSPIQSSHYLLHLLEISAEFHQHHTAISATVTCNTTRHQVGHSISQICKEHKSARPNFPRSKVHVAARTRDVLSSFLDSWPLTMGQIVCTETSIRDYLYNNNNSSNNNIY